MPNQAGQSASGSFIAQASGGSTATVTDNRVTNVYQFAPPAPVDGATLAAALARLDEMPLDHVPGPAPLPRGSRMTLAHNPLFVGRQDDLLALARTLKGGATTAIGQTAAATGLGGIGKTQLAAEFANRYGRFFTGGVFWLSFASAESVAGEIASCGGVGAMDLRPDFGNLKQDEQVAAVLSKWQDGLPRLLVFDNCESENLLANWRPPSGACRMLVSSRRAEWDPALGVQALALDVLLRAESVALLRGFRPDLSDEDPDLDAIAVELGDLPLALHLAGSYLHRYVHTSVGTPAKLLTELRRPDLLEHRSLTGVRDQYPPTGNEMHLARTFAISWDQLRPDDEIDTLAREALAHAARLAPGETIPRRLLLATLQLDDGQGLQGEDALGRLTSLGLIETQQDGGLRLHRLLAAFVRQLHGLDRRVPTVVAVEKGLANEAGRLIEAGYPAALLGWPIHLRWAAEQAAQRGRPSAGDLYSCLGRYLELVGDYPGARTAYERGLTIDEATLGRFNLALSRDSTDLGSVLNKLGDLAGARAAYERALEIDEMTYGPNHRLVAFDFSNLGLLLQDVGDLVGARAACERALQIGESANGPDHPDVAMLVSSLGRVWQKQGDLALARSAYERALKINEAAYGPDHPTVAGNVNDLGRVRQEQGDLAGARAAYQRALKIDEAISGTDHPEVATDVNNLGLLLWKQGDLAGARAAFERALKINEATYGQDHSTVAGNVNSLGNVLRDQGDLAGARSAFERVLKIWERALGPDHPSTQGMRRILDSLVDNSTTDTLKT